MNQAAPEISAVHRLPAIRRATACLLLAVLAVLAATAREAPAATRVPLTMQANVPFPVRVFAVDLSAGARARAIAVTENGRRVAAELTPIRRKRVPFSAAVVLDTSLTMTGGPFVAARAAAETLIAGKLPRAELALIGFSARPYLLHGWSARKRDLTASLTGLRTSYGTAVWDAVVLASKQLRHRQGSAKAIVVLTDGRRDTTSTRAQAAISAARTTGARVFVVIAGKGEAAQRGRLRRVTRATGGALVSVRSIPELRRSFAALTRTISRQYLVSYSSPIRKPGGRVVVRADFGRAYATSTYRIPARPPETGTSFWFTTAGSILILIGVLGLIGAAVGGLVIATLRSRPRYWYRRY